MIHSCCPFRTLYILTCLIVVTHSNKLTLIIGRYCCSSFVSTWIHIQFFMRSVLLILFVFCVVFCLSSLCVLCWPMLSVSLDCQVSIVPSAFTHIIHTDVSCGYGAVAYFPTLQCFVLTLDISFMITGSMSTRSTSIFKDPNVAIHLSLLCDKSVIVSADRALTILFLCVNHIT